MIIFIIMHDHDHEKLLRCTYPLPTISLSAGRHRVDRHKKNCVISIILIIMHDHDQMMIYPLPTSSLSASKLPSKAAHNVGVIPSSSLLIVLTFFSVSYSDIQDQGHPILVPVLNGMTIS